MKTIIVAAITALVVGAGGATAASLISSAQIRNGTIRNRDIHKGTISLNRLTTGTQRLIRAHGANGLTGATGPAGSTGQQGAQGPAGKDAITGVTTLSSDINVAAPAWASRAGTDGGPTSAPTPHIVAGGAELGPFADGSQFAAVVYNGLNGIPISQIADITYTESYLQSGTDAHGAAPYFRVFTQDSGGTAHSVVFSPNTQPGNDIASGRTQKWDVVQGGVRYDDDAGASPDMSWNALIDAHGSETITSIRVQAGDGGAYTDQAAGFVHSVTTEVDGRHAQRFDFGS